MNDFFTFTKGERVAIIVLAAVILLIIAANFFVANHPSNVNYYLHNLDSILSQQTTVNGQRSTGLRQAQAPLTVNSQQSFLESEKSQRSTVNSQRSTGLRQAQAPLTVNGQQSFLESGKSQRSTIDTRTFKSIKINSADTTELKSLPGIGSFFAKNIVEYRDKLGGIVELNQLLDVYAFDSARLETIKPYIIIDSVETRKVKINSDNFKTILRHPYIEYEDVKKIFNYRESRGMIKNWDTYLKVVERDSIDKRLKLYLEF